MKIRKSMKSRESWEFKKSKKVGEKGKVEKVEPVFLTKNQKNRTSRICFFYHQKYVFTQKQFFYHRFISARQNYPKNGCTI